MVDNKIQFRMSFEIHNISCRKNSDFYHPSLHLTIYQEGQFYVGIKSYKCLPPEIKYLSHNTNKFKSSPRSFLHQHSFHTMGEYLNYKTAL